MTMKISMVALIPIICGALGFILMIPGSIMSGNVAYETIKDYAPLFTAEFYSPEQQNDDVRNLWVTIGVAAAVVGLLSSVLTIWFPLGFGKGLILCAIVAAFVCIAFNVLVLASVILFAAGGVFAMVALKKNE
jgi:hypothetical protein